MALIICSECGKEISDKAEACPHCGCPVSGEIKSNSFPMESADINKEIDQKSNKIRWIKPWMLIVGAGVLAAVILFIVITSLPSKYKWNEVILKTALPEPTSEYGRLYTNDADDLYLTVNKVSFSEYESYVDNCVSKGFTFVVESDSSSYTAFNSEGYELDLDYHEYNEALDISLDVRVSGTIKWSNSKLAALLPVPKSNVGSIVNDYTYGYEVYIGDVSKSEYDTYISECKINGFNLNEQIQNTAFYAENELGYELTVEYYECGLIYIDLNVPEDISDEEDDSDEEETKNEETKQTDSIINDSSSETTSKTNSNSSSNNKTHICEASGCTKNGTKTYTGISSKTEYYCETHYNELIDMMSDMEEDVGKGSYSKHTCEECSREGTYSIIGISGKTEYYCSTHYNELKEFMEIFK